MAQAPGRAQGLDPVIAVALVAAAVPGLPGLGLTLAALVGGYSWQALPFDLALPAAVVACVPLVAAGTSRIGGRQLGWVIAGVVMAVMSALVVGLIALVFLLLAPLSLLDDSGKAISNFDSILGVALVGGVTAVANGVLAGTMLATRRQRSGRGLSRHLLLSGGAALGLALGAAALVGVIGSRQTDAAGIPTGPISGAWISARDEARLIYPGAQIVYTSIAGESKQLGAGTPADALVDFYTSDPPNVVAAWYRAKLQDRGWYLENAPSFSTDAQRAFRRGRRELFFLEQLTPGIYPGDASHPGQQHFQSRYTVLASAGG